LFPFIFSFLPSFSSASGCFVEETMFASPICWYPFSCKSLCRHLLRFSLSTFSKLFFKFVILDILYYSLFELSNLYLQHWKEFSFMI
jgi:hypothetical protein